jgi:DNA topoisomerase III
MILYIAEKPSLGRAIADALPKPHQRGDGFIRTQDGVVSWCVGHMLEQAEPEAYDPAYKRWSHEHLPIVPETWKLKEKKQTAKQLGVLRKLMKDAETIVHAGDPDREGQLLVDEVIHYLGRDPQTARRVLISDLNRAAVQASLGQLRSNREFGPLSTSALARSRADWLYGINLTRAYTLQGQKVNYKGVLSVGRVQTPLLGLVVSRDEDIASFVSKPFYEVWANLRTDEANGAEMFRARWIPSEECARFLDSDGRNLSRPLADNVAQRVSNQPATVTEVDRKKRHGKAPLPHSLSSLQIDAAKLYQLPAQRVLDVCQALYEQHKLITYPRSDCRYLPQAHHQEAEQVIASVRSNPGADKFAEAWDMLELRRRGRAWDDSRVDAHHAIIPTRKTTSRLSSDEERVYGLVCRNYLAQFLPDHEYSDTRVSVDIKGGSFVARAREDIAMGWRTLFTNSASGKHNSPSSQRLPSMNKADVLQSLQAEVLERHTSPPAYFTDATLLMAMTGVSAFVSDPDLRRILKDTDGLGTEATRAGIIELLFRRGFLARKGKHIESTEAGRGLINALPKTATLPDMTARWESVLTAITERTATYLTLMEPLIVQVTQLVADSRQQLPSGLAGLSAPSKKRKAGNKSGKWRGGTGRKKPSRKTTGNKTQKQT